ncbi:hypothetical protein FHS29_001921 [Saccharothrix tamanrassetensis]|uniref:Ricin B lectin domain-containing protein n=1 Tax=Saccharothrix tamanrassetensis TaxID=1051531 RepID=A0A841CEC4_9PSEU|nr:RICIN domain-containing protein [Saccharothrix tamanrassetensis]MBB5955340.1 hypothetical protein [Saccharothrix tamanrassetensis]
MRRITVSLLTGALAVLALLVAPSGASAEPLHIRSAAEQGLSSAPRETYYFRNDHSGKCLDVYGWSTADGGEIVQWNCHYGNNQLFEGIYHGDGSYSLKSVHSGKCIDLYGWSNDTGAKIVQWDCHFGNNQRWIPTWYEETASIRLLSKHSGKALEVHGWSREDGAKAVQWDWHGGANQRWY